MIQLNFTVLSLVLSLTESHGWMKLMRSSKELRNLKNKRQSIHLVFSLKNLLNWLYWNPEFMFRYALFTSIAISILKILYCNILNPVILPWHGFVYVKLCTTVSIYHLQLLVSSILLNIIHIQVAFPAIMKATMLSQ